MADKAALEMIGVVLFAATLLVIGAGGLAVRHQFATEDLRVGTAQLATLSDPQTARAGMIPAPTQVLK